MHECLSLFQLYSLCKLWKKWLMYCTLHPFPIVISFFFGFSCCSFLDIEQMSSSSCRQVTVIFLSPDCKMKRKAQHPLSMCQSVQLSMSVLTNDGSYTVFSHASSAVTLYVHANMLTMTVPTCWWWAGITFAMFLSNPQPSLIVRYIWSETKTTGQTDCSDLMMHWVKSWNVQYVRLLAETILKTKHHQQKNQQNEKKIAVLITWHLCVVLQGCRLKLA